MAVSRRRALRRSQMLAVALLVTLGCGDSGPARLAIEGNITADGEPATLGEVVFLPEGSGPTALTSVFNGSYQFTRKTGPVAGS